MEQNLEVAVIGATGAVGQILIELIKSRKFPTKKLRAFASASSEGKKIDFKNLDSTWTYCEVLNEDSFKGVDLAFFDASDEISKQWVPFALKAGCRVIDNSATYRMDPDTPLIVPEINGHLTLGKNLIAGPNCTTAQLVGPLQALRDFGIKRVCVSTYQAVSGAGSLAVQEMKNQDRSEVMNSGFLKPVIFPYTISHNLIPQIGGFKDDGYTSEELKVIFETRKILDIPHLKITCTAVRVPVERGHSESVNIEFENRFEMDEIVAKLRTFSGISVWDDPSKREYPMPLFATDQDPVFVGRIRRDFSVDNGINIWIVADNLRKGAALNAIQIAEKLLDEKR